MPKEPELFQLRWVVHRGTKQEQYVTRQLEYRTVRLVVSLNNSVFLNGDAVEWTAWQPVPMMFADAAARAEQ